MQGRRDVRRGSVIAALLLSTAWSAPLAAATVTVTSTGDASATDGAVTLREAIESLNAGANVNADVVPAGAYGSNDTIAFAIPGPGPHTIPPITQLPALAVPMTVDGLTQPANGGAAASCTAGPLLVVIDGSMMTSSGTRYGLSITAPAPGVLVRGLVIQGFSSGTGIGIRVRSGGNRVQCNFLGTDPAGGAVAANRTDVWAQKGDGNLIGSDGDGSNDAAEANLISGATLLGINVAPAADNPLEVPPYFGGTTNDTVIRGNKVGTNLAGTAHLQADVNNNGIEINGTIFAADRPLVVGNLISGNRGGLALSAVNDGRVVGNTIGPDLAGMAVVTTLSGFGQTTGVSLAAGASGNVVGTDGDGQGDAAERNLISGNSNGVFISGGTDNRIAGNWIGPNATGNAALTAVTNTGVSVGGATSTGNVVGTDGDGLGDAAERNVISGNGAAGVSLSSPNGNRISGNTIGLGADGVTAVGNATGIQVQISGTATTGNDIGTNVDGNGDALEGNVVSGNLLGIALTGASTQNQRVAGNVIGLALGGGVARPNTSGGITIHTGAHDNVIGSAANAVAANVIAGNGSAGVRVSAATTTGNDITGNFIGINATGTAIFPNPIGIDLLTGSSTRVRRNVIFGSTVRGLQMDLTALLAATSADNCVVRNAAGAVSTHATEPSFENNWWGVATGPNTPGGDTESGLDSDPWLGAAPALGAACPTILVPTIGKSFAASAIPLGGTTTLTVTIANPTTGAATAVAFTDSLPAGLQVAATPAASASLGCGAGTWAPAAGDTTLTFAGGTIAANGTCTLQVAVTGTTVGPKANQITNLTMVSSVPPAPSSNTATVTVVGGLSVGKSFTTDPVSPGATVTMVLTIANGDPTNGVTGLNLSDNLGAALAGLAVTGSPVNTCGGIVAGTSFLTLTGGSLGPAGACSITVTLQVPLATATGSYLNTTGAPGGSILGAAVTGAPASDTLLVSNTLAITKSFTNDPVAPGGTVILSFDIRNFTASAATAVAFTDDLGAVVSGLTPLGLPASFCGGTLSYSAPNLTFSGGTLTAGEVCTITVTLQVPGGAPAGLHPNTTSAITGTIAGPVTGNFAVDSLRVLGGLVLSKAFTTDPVAAGNVVSLQFMVTNTDPAFAATGITFADNLNAVIAGMTTTGLLPPTPCGSGSSLTGGSTVSLLAGQLPPGGSCSFTVSVLVPANATPNNYLNTTGAVTGTIAGVSVVGTMGSDTLAVIGNLTLSKSFTDDPTPPSGTVTLSFTVTNTDPNLAATGISFSDNLNLALAGLQITGGPTPSPPCGVGSSITLTGTFLLTLDNGSLPAGGSCTFAMTLQLPAGALQGLHTNTTSDVTGTVGTTSVTGAPASDDLRVIGNLFLSKAFLDPRPAGSNVTLRFTIGNSDQANAASNIAFTDDLDAVLPGASDLVPTGLPASVCGGTLSYAAPNLTFSGGSLAAAANCIIDVVLQIPAGTPEDTYPNTTSPLSGQILGQTVGSGPASDSLDVIGNLGISKAFSGPVAPGGTVTLQFTIVNTSTTLDATDVGFTDNIDFVLPGPNDLVPSGLPSNQCGGGTLTYSSPSLTFSGGSIPFNGSGTASCVISVTLGVPATTNQGVYPNTTGNVTGTISSVAVTGNTASADLTVVGGVALAKQFLTAVAAGGTVNLRFTVTNTDQNNAATVSFTDPLAAGLLVGATLPANPCGTGALLGGAGTGSFSFANGTLGAGASCIFTIPVDVPVGTTPGTYTNTTDPITGTILGVAVSGPTAMADVTVVGGLTITKSFSGPVEPGNSVTLTFTVENTDPLNPATSIFFNDQLNPVWSSIFVSSALPVADPCGAGSMLTGNGPPVTVITLSGGSLGPSGALDDSCTFAVTLQIPADVPPGDHLNSTSPVTGTILGVGVSGPAATATLVAVGEVTVAKSFTDGPVLANATTTQQVTLQFDLTNTDPDSPAALITFNDPLPSPLVANSVISNNCGAAIAGTGTSTLVITGGSLAAAGTCTIEIAVDVPAGTAVGDYVNTTSTVSALIDTLTVTAPAATATLQVIPSISVGKQFVFEPTVAGGVVRLSISIFNADPTHAATGINFTDDLNNLPNVVAGPPITLSVDYPSLILFTIPYVDVCGAGSLLTESGNVLTFTNVSLGPGSSCTLGIPVRVPTGAPPGTYRNTTTPVTGTVDGQTVDGGTASDDITVIGSLQLTKSFTDDPALPGGTVTLEFVLTNTDPTNIASGIIFDDDLAPVVPGMTALGLPIANPCGAGSSLNGSNGDTMISLAGGNLAPGASCPFSVTLQLPANATAGNHLNTTSLVFGNVGSTPMLVPAATDTLVVIGDLQLVKSFTDDPVTAGGTVTLELTITNPNPGFAASGITFSDNLTAVLPGLTTTGVLPLAPCGGGSLLTGGSTIQLTGGNLPAGGSCTFLVTLQMPAAATPGSHLNTTSTISGMVGSVATTGPAATDSLVVVGGLTLAISFTDDPVTPGGQVTLQVTITNGDPANGASAIAFSHDLEAALSGLAAVGPLPPDPCGGGSTLSGTNVLTLAGGNLPAGGTCTFPVTLQVPAGATPGSYPNTTSSITGMVGAGSVIGAPASDTLVVAAGVSTVEIPTLSDLALLVLMTVLAGLAWRMIPRR